MFLKDIYGHFHLRGHSQDDSSVARQIFSRQIECVRLCYSIRESCRALLGQQKNACFTLVSAGKLFSLNPAVGGYIALILKINFN